MRTFQIPEAQTIIVNGEAQTITFADLNRDNVLSAPEWRVNATTAELFAEVIEQTRHCLHGTHVVLSDAAFEIYLPLITLRGKQINAENAESIMALMRPVLRATHKPETAAKTDGA